MMDGSRILVNNATMKCTAWMVLLAACGVTNADGETSVTAIDGVAQITDDLKLAVVQSDAGTRTAYLCGQGERLADSRWFSGWDLLEVVDDSTWSLSLDGLTYDLSDGDSGWTGELVALEDDGTSGLYDADTGCRTGAIVEGGEVVGTWCDAMGAYRQVEPIGTLHVEDGRLPLQVQLDGDTIEFDALRIAWSGS